MPSSRPKPKPKSFSDTDLLAPGLKVTRTVTAFISASVADDPTSALEKVLVGARRKPALKVDVSAEETFKYQLHHQFERRYASIEFHGEESLRDPILDLSGRPGTCALVDAVDGTDLVERGLSNWCCASVFFCPTNPPGSRILGAFVGVPVDVVDDKPRCEVYYALACEKSPSVKYHTSEPEALKGPSGVTRLVDASVCFYGQKASNLASVVNGLLLRNCVGLLRHHAQRGEEIDLRMYNLAGIPMMLKLAHHAIPTARGIDAVFDLEGQKPHDVVPGVFIAKKAGAILIDIDSGKEIGYDRLEELLMQPANLKLRYILAATKELAEDLRTAILKPLCAGVDENDAIKCTGTKEQIIAKGLGRRAVHVFVFNAQRQLLISKRPNRPDKAYPGRWTSSAGGRVELGESYTEAARRELAEELCITTPVHDVGPFKVRDDHGLVIHRLFRTEYGDSPILPDRQEIEDYRFEPPESIHQQVARNPERYAPSFIEALQLYLLANPPNEGMHPVAQKAGGG